jgi:hypothetical protein
MEELVVEWRALRTLAVVGLVDGDSSIPRALVIVDDIAGPKVIVAKDAPDATAVASIMHKAVQDHGVMNAIAKDYVTTAGNTAGHLIVTVEIETIDNEVVGILAN